jgi:hypothetical protein
MAIAFGPVLSLLVFAAVPDQTVSKALILAPLFAVAILPAWIFSASAQRQKFPDLSAVDIVAVQQIVQRGEQVQEVRLAPAVLKASRTVINGPPPAILLLMTMALGIGGSLYTLHAEASDARKILATITLQIMTVSAAALFSPLALGGKRRAQAANHYAQNLLTQQPA